MTDKEYVDFKDGEMIINFMYEPPPPPEFRLYYDENGDVLFYTGEKAEGDNYIVVDHQTFAECRHDIKVIDGKIVYKKHITEISKLQPSNSGTPTHTDDLNIIVDEEDTNAQYWKFSNLQIIRK